MRALENLAEEKAAAKGGREAREERERALSLLERELRSSLDRGTVDGSRLDAFLDLRGLGDGSRLALVIRSCGPARSTGPARLAGSARLAAVASPNPPHASHAPRLAELAERILRLEGWYALGGSDGEEARIAAAAPRPAVGGNTERPRTALERIAAEALSSLGLRVLIGASPSFPADGPGLFAAARDAASLARPDENVVLLLPADGERAPSASGDEGAAGGAAIVERALEYMRSRLSDDLSLSDVAEAVGYSPFYLSRLFGLHGGDGFVQAYTRLRLDAAKALLRTGRYSVKEACALVGFRDQAYFARVFRRREGCSPVEFIARSSGN